MARGLQLTIETLVKTYADHRAVDGVSLTVPPGALLTLLGPSGCGKTTLMRSIAGFVTPDSGRILVDGQDLRHLLPEQRSTAMLFQNYGLFPHMTVAANVGFGPRMKGASRAETSARVTAMLRLARIEELATRYPSEISGGQQQRVALARALATEPKVLLLDEPFGALDQSLREQVQIELRKLQQSLGTTTLVVTHDQLEALTLSDLVAVMNAGRIEQVAPPNEVYDRPATAFVARFMGVENLLAARVEASDASTLRVSSGALSAVVQKSADAVTANVTIAVRAAAVRIGDPGEAGVASGQIRFASNRGSSALYEVATEDEQTIFAAEERRGRPLRPVGSRVGVSLIGQACAIVRD